jgi:hypothetical protein
MAVRNNVFPKSASVIYVRSLVLAYHPKMIFVSSIETGI